MSISDLCTTFVNSAKLKDEIERNIIEFAEAPWGLGMGTFPEVPPLFPVQKFLFKCYYNIPLDNVEHPIIVKDKFNEKERYRFTEEEYLHFLYEEGRININEVTGDPKLLRPNILLVIGRRGCKTSTVAVLVAFETYRLLKKICPQTYYRIMPDQEIRISCIATNQEQSGELFRMVTAHLERSEYFSKYRNKPTLSYMQLSTQWDIEKFSGNRPSLRLVASPCSGRGLRGHNNIIAILDEMAYFFEEDNSPDRSDANIYKAVTPSVAKFNSPEGDPHGKVICISSPNEKKGKFFELYQKSFDPQCDDLLMIQAPTWEIDHTLSPKFLRSAYVENPVSFNVEYGAQFSDKISAWIENEQILRFNIIPGLKQKTISYDRVPHFMGIDVGLKKDGTSICVCHVEKQEMNGTLKDTIELDAIATRYASDEGKDFFSPEEMALWIYEWTKKFYIIKGLLDQYYGLAIVPVLHKQGVKQIEAKYFSRDFNSRIYQNLMIKMMDGLLRIPESDPYEDHGKKCTDLPLIKELLSLKATRHSKHIVTVSAPEIKGMHDDESDSFSRAVWLATEFLDAGGMVSRNILAPVSGDKGTSYRKYYQKHKRSSLYTNRPSTRLQSELHRSRGVHNHPGNSLIRR